jgi:hypothetical protein
MKAYLGSGVYLHALFDMALDGGESGVQYELKLSKDIIDVSENV